MAVAVTNTPILAFNTVTAVTRSLATSTTDNEAEVFTITPAASGGKMIIEFAFDNKLATAAAGNNSTFSIAAGAFSGAKAVTGTITKATNKCIQVETSRVLSATGTVVITVTPGTDDSLTTNNAAAVTVFELL